MLQFVRYVFIGALINFFGYVVYLWLSYLWGAPKLTMTALYFLSASVGFIVNRRFIFLHEGRIDAAGARYLLAHVSGYLLNLMLLFFFVDCMGFPHEIVQAISILLVAVFLFLMLRFFVFKPRIPLTVGDAL